MTTVTELPVFEAIKILDMIDDRYYILRMDKETFEQYGLDQNHQAEYQKTIDSLAEASTAPAYEVQDALDLLKA